MKLNKGIKNMKFQKEEFLLKMNSGERVITFKLPDNPTLHSFHPLKNRLEFEIELRENEKIGITTLKYPYIDGGQYQLIYKNSTLTSNEVMEIIAETLSKQEFF